MHTRRWSKWGGLTIALGVIVLGIAACGPESTRMRDGGLGGSSRPTAPPSVVSEPALVVQPTTNIPYATPGALPTLQPLPTAAVGAATPANQPAVPTGPAGPANPATPGVVSGTPSTPRP